MSGVVAINAADPNPPGFASPGAQGPVVLHELAHVLGLGHIKAQGELMEPSGGGVIDFGPGDLEGLRQLGSSAGCLATPAVPSAMTCTVALHGLARYPGPPVGCCTCK